MLKRSFIPCNAVEMALVAAMQGKMSVPDFIKTLMESDVHVPSSTEVGSDGTGFRPLLFDKDGETFMSVFTDRQRVKPFTTQVPYCLEMKGEHLFKRIPSGFGMVINPGWDVGMEIPSQGVLDIRQTVPFSIVGQARTRA